MSTTAAPLGCFPLCIGPFLLELPQGSDDGEPEMGPVKDPLCMSGGKAGAKRTLTI